MLKKNRQIEVKLDLPNPVAGFAAVSLGNGKFMISSKSLKLTVHNPDNSELNPTQNIIQVFEEPNIFDRLVIFLQGGFSQHPDGGEQQGEH